EQDPYVPFDLGKDGIDVHVVPFFGNTDDRDLLYHAFFEQYADGLVGGFGRGPLAYADEQVILADDHDVAAFQRYLPVIAFPWQEEVVMGVGQLYDLVLVFPEERV